VIPAKTAESEAGTFKQVMKTRAVHLLAFFVLIYVGVEVTIGGWIVTFIIKVRGGGPSAGYISSGFFGGQFGSLNTIFTNHNTIHLAGLTLGRVLLLWVNKKAFKFPALGISHANLIQGRRTTGPVYIRDSFCWVGTRRLACPILDRKRCRRLDYWRPPRTYVPHSHEPSCADPSALDIDRFYWVDSWVRTGWECNFAVYDGCDCWEAWD